MYDSSGNCENLAINNTISFLALYRVRELRQVESTLLHGRGRAHEKRRQRSCRVRCRCPLLFLSAKEREGGKAHVAIPLTVRSRSPSATDVSPPSEAPRRGLSEAPSKFHPADMRGCCQRASPVP